jgi:hypothetical protein
MRRTTVSLPSELRERAEQAARAEGLSLSAFIEKTLTSVLSEPGKKKRARDPLFADEAVFDGTVPKDTAVNHDRYLYGDRK